MDRTTVAVVLAGGTGTRLYPAARSDRPKQLLAPGGDRTLLARAVDRAGFADRRVVLTAPAHAEGIREGLADAGFRPVPFGGDPGTARPDDADAPAVEVLVEPEPKDTGPALVYAAARVRADAAGGLDAGADRDDPVLFCLPSDHHVAGPFDEVARRAVRVAVETRGLVTVGIDPSRSATGYGYLDPGREEDGYAPVRAFHEKPDADRARELVAEGCLWNAGTFAWLPSAFLRAARATPLAPLVAAATPEESDPGSLDRRLRDAYARVPATSVDRAVMEGTDEAFVAFAPPALEWDDLGTWDALGRVLPTDDAGNATLGEALTVGATGSVVAGVDAHVTAVDVEGLVVAAYDDRVLVVPADRADRVREAVRRLREDDLF